MPMKVNWMVAKILNLEFYDTKEAAGTLTTTTILDEPREIVLNIRFRDQIVVQDPMENAWKVLGSAVHLLFELALKEFKEKEQRLYATFMGHKLSGKYDIVLDGVMSDYKVTKAGTLQWAPDGDPKWRDQLSINRWFYWKAKGITLKGYGDIYAYIKNWEKKHLLKFNRMGKYYPEYPFGVVSMPLLDFKDTEELLTRQLLELNRYITIPNNRLNEIPFCVNAYSNRIKCKEYCDVRHICKQISGGQNEKG